MSCLVQHLIKSTGYETLKSLDPESSSGRVKNKGFFSSLLNKKPSLWMKDWVFFYLTLHSLPSKTYCEAHSGRFSGLRIVLLPAPSHPFRPFDKLRVQDSGFGKFRTRLQRRGRPRLSRGSLWLQAT